MAPSVPKKVVVHPLVLLSVVDHYNRAAKDTRKRVVGVLLGETSRGQIDVTNSYAVPFEEDEKDPTIWFLDHNYHENMFRMFKKINAKEHVIGWYSTGPKIKESDMNINSLIGNYCTNPVLVIIDVQTQTIGIPTKAYVMVEEVGGKDVMKSQQVFAHVPSEIGAYEAEEIGVEHLLRDVKDASVSTLATEVSRKLASLKGLGSQMGDIKKYLKLVADGTLPVNHEILNYLQEILNLLPNLDLEEMVKSFAIETNDMMLVIYLAAMIRSVTALHNLINNKMERLQAKEDGVVGPVT